MKAKTHTVRLGDGSTHLVMALTQAGALRDAIEHVTRDLREGASVDLATGEEIYQAGIDSREIIGSTRYKQRIDPSQLPLTGVPETAGETAAAFVLPD